jgi:hypothetical protein
MAYALFNVSGYLLVTCGEGRTGACSDLGLAGIVSIVSALTGLGASVIWVASSGYLMGLCDTDRKTVYAIFSFYLYLNTILGNGLASLLFLFPLHIYYLSLGLLSLFALFQAYHIKDHPAPTAARSPAQAILQLQEFMSSSRRERVLFYVFSGVTISSICTVVGKFMLLILGDDPLVKSKTSLCLLSLGLGLVLSAKVTEWHPFCPYDTALAAVSFAIVMTACQGLAVVTSSAWLMYLGSLFLGISENLIQYAINLILSNEDESVVLSIGIYRFFFGFSVALLILVNLLLTLAGWEVCIVLVGLALEGGAFWSVWGWKLRKSSFPRPDHSQALLQGSHG